MEELLRQMVAALVDYPEQIRVKEIRGENSIVYELQVGPGELGKVIGRQGQMVRSLRTIMTAAGMKLRKQVRLELIENSARSERLGAGTNV